jgi:peptidoglycan hydrolase-like protein with peptidoglycan-binding domain
MNGTPALVLAALLLLAAQAAKADFHDGLLAYEAHDYATASSELRPLAEAGDARAQRYVGLLYRDGRGVPQDFARAHMWLNLAAAAGQAEAAAERDELAERMDRAQIAEAQRLASAWQPASAAAPTAAPSASAAGARSVPAAGASTLAGGEIVDLQWQLAVHGYDPGPADGIVGARTRAAIRDYQRDANLAVDGIASRGVLDHLRFADPPVRSARATGTGSDASPTLYRPDGIERVYVVTAQQELAARSYRVGPIDGIVGPRTREAIRRYQRTHGLPVDGRVSLALVNHLRLVGGSATLTSTTSY